MYAIKTTIAVAESLINKDIETCAKKIEEFKKELTDLNSQYVEVNSLPWWSSTRLLFSDMVYNMQKSNLVSYITQLQDKIASLTTKIQRLHDSVDGYVYVEVK